MKIMKMSRIQKRVVPKRILSVFMSVVMMLTMAGISRSPLLSVKAAGDDVVSSTEALSSGDTVSVRVADQVQLQIQDETYDMLSYGSNIYETGVDLSAGTYQVNLLVNGEVKLQEDSFEVGEAQKIYFRLQDEVLKTSLNDGIVSSAAMTGDMTGVTFLQTPEDATQTFSLAYWDPADANGELEYLGGGRYKKTFYIVDLAADTSVSYKVAFNDGWDNAIGDNGDNINVTIPAGTTSFTVYVDEIGQTVYDSVRSGSFELVQNAGNVYKSKLDTVVSLIGDVRGNETDNWDPATTGYEFTQISDSLYLYQKTFAAGSYNYKTVFDYTEWYENGGNIALEITEDGENVVFLYDSTTGKLYDTVNNEDVVAEYLNMDASVIKPSVSDLKNGSTYFVMSDVENATVKLFYGNKSDVAVNGESVMESVDMQEKDGGKYVSDDIYFGDDALDLVYYYEVNGERVVITSVDCVEVNGVTYMNYTREAFTGRVVNVPGSFPGASWDPASNQMTYLGNGLYTYTFENVPPANYEYKISFGSWSENYGADGASDGANIAVTVTETQDVTILYNDFSHKSVNSIDYVTADISLTGTGIPENTTLLDATLNGIYLASVTLPAGTYSDLEMHYDGVDYAVSPFTITTEKTVNFYFDPVSLIYYNDASDVAIDTSKIYYNTQDTDFKSVYGAVATGETVTFSIESGTDITEVRMVLKGVHKQNLEMEKSGEAEDGVQKWSVTASFDQIGESSYYFVLSNGSSVTAYADDDGYYGEGKTTSLTSIQPYDLIIYQSGYETPDWMKNAVIYQIFPDRFYDADTSNDQIVTSARGTQEYEYVYDWSTLPENPDQEELLTEDEYAATGAYAGDGNFSNEIYGGDIEGITERIEYLKAVGVNVIYLNPVFASISSHRYDTSDYSMIDPILGDLGDFDELVEVAEANDMHIILDGVFNHVSDDSVYFDRYYKYLNAGATSIGAYPYWAYVYDLVNEEGVSQDYAETQAKNYFTTNYGITDFSYTEWFEINNTALLDEDGLEVSDTIGDRSGKVVYGYEGWWGYDSMPVILSTDGSEYQTGNWAEQIIGNEDETSVTQYWLNEGADGWRLDVANEVSDETWQQFRESVKALDSDYVIVGEIWTDAVKYLMGDMYDSVMNYVFRNAVLAYVNGGDSDDTTKTLEKLRERYPEEAFYAMMNLLGSHDTARLLSALDGIEDDRAQTDVEYAFPTYESTSDLAKQKQYLAAFLQFTYAGAPTIYYGDEIGMVGADDPDNRRGFTWGQGSEELVSWYATLAEIRSQYTALRTGTVEPLSVDENIMGYVRRDESDTMVVLANNTETDTDVTLSLDELDMAADQLTDLISGTVYNIANGTVTIHVPALSGVILTENVKEIVIDQEALAPAYDESYIVGIREGASSEDPEVTDDPEQADDPEESDDPAKIVDVVDPEETEDPHASAVSDEDSNQDSDVLVADTSEDDATSEDAADSTQDADQSENNVQTKDSSRIVAYGSLLILSIGLMGYAIYFRKRRKKL